MALKRTPSIEDRLAEFGTLDRPVTLEEIELSLPFSERVLLPLITGLADFAMRFSPEKSREAMQHKLDLAGNPYDLKKFIGIRVLATIMLGGLGGALMLLAKSLPTFQRILLPAVGAGLGYYFPVLSLGSKIRKRQKEIIKSLPDALDLLTICVEAGLGFDAAMAKVAEKWDNELSMAFSQVINEIQLGKLRREALRNMADRMEVQDVSTFVAAIIQADQLGVSIARVLRIQSDQMRMRRRQRAEELAAQAGIKMLPAIAFLIFPAIFIVLLGPAVIQVIIMVTEGTLSF
ncbi:MAG: type II secretion system F family protein [Chloroflexi bacterium]|nr:MAG: type II secretion system F family protein [Chloroflexota bacterium]